MKTGVILDTDIGYDPDDFFALLLLLNSTELPVDLIVTGDEVGGKRAALVTKVLGVCDRKISVVQGVDLGNNKHFTVDALVKDAPACVDTDYLNEMRRVCDTSDRVVYLGIGGFTNLANLLSTHPDVKEKLDVYPMGGAVGYVRRAGWVEHNAKLDPDATRSVLTSGVKLSLVMAQTTYNSVYEINDKHPIYRRLKESERPEHRLLVQHCDLFYAAKGFWSLMHDPLTVSVAMGNSFVDFYDAGVSVDGQGNLAISEVNPKIRLSKTESRAKEFMEFLEQRLFV